MAYIILVVIPKSLVIHSLPGCFFTNYQSFKQLILVGIYYLLLIEHFFLNTKADILKNIRDNQH